MLNEMVMWTALSKSCLFELTACNVQYTLCKNWSGFRWPWINLYSLQSNNNEDGAFKFEFMCFLQMFYLCIQ